MTLPLDQSNVSLGSTFNPMLVNLQANILKFHGRKFAHHLFIKIKHNKIEEAKQWIVYFASSKVTSSYVQLYDTQQRQTDKNFDGGPVYTLSLSNHGYEKLNAHSSITQNETFKHGLRGSAVSLKDNIDDWEKEFKKNHIDILVIVADDDAGKAHQLAHNVIHQVNAFGECVKNQRGNVLKMRGTKVGIEHFGYADGISQPMYLADEINKQPRSPVWDDTTDLDMVLVKEEDGTDNCFGSYFVFRKLEQNVKGFKDAEGDNGATPGKILIKISGTPTDVKDDAGIENDELGGAMIVGRFENSTPVTKAGRVVGPDPDSNHLNNDFDYSDDLSALKCPFHSHIRLVNPRKGNTSQDPVEIRSHRITRRGITFDDSPVKRIPDDKITDITGEMLDNNQPTGKVGLLFMCYQSDIETHFEELQGQWANTGVIDPATTSIGQDSLITQSAPDAASMRTIPQQWNKAPQCDAFNFSGFITMRGGEYFYTPSIPFLKSL